MQKHHQHNLDIEELVCSKGSKVDIWSKRDTLNCRCHLTVYEVAEIFWAADEGIVNTGADCTPRFALVVPLECSGVNSSESILCEMGVETADLFRIL